MVLAMNERPNGKDLSNFLRTEAWIFDLDNTLYPAGSNLFAQIDKRMNEFIAHELGVSLDAAAAMRRQYYHDYGSTLAGLMRHHGVNPERFLDYVHDIDLAAIDETPPLKLALAALPGRRFIFTNGSRRHAERVATKLGVIDVFDDVFDIAASGFTGKPDRTAYERFVTSLDVEANAAAMFEDLPGNLASSHDLGMNTVLVKAVDGGHPYDPQARQLAPIRRTFITSPTI